MKLIKRLTIPILLGLIAHSSLQSAGGREPRFAERPEAVTTNQAQSLEKISILSFDARSLPAEMRYQGKLVMGARWTDGNGENFLLLTQTGKFPSKGKCDADEGTCFDAEVYAYNYLRKDSKISLLWKIMDFERDCAFDLYAGFLKNSLFITDLDSNGVAESLFLYKRSCRSDVSPAGLKLMMHEGAAKYAIRGTTKLPGDDGGGEMNVDAAFNNANPMFKKFAVEKWNQHVIKDDFEQF